MILVNKRFIVVGAILAAIVIMAVVIGSPAGPIGLDSLR